jgi:hypothetical protein
MLGHHSISEAPLSTESDTGPASVSATDLEAILFVDRVVAAIPFSYRIQNDPILLRDTILSLVYIPPKTVLESPALTDIIVRNLIARRLAADSPEIVDIIRAAILRARGIVDNTGPFRDTWSTGLSLQPTTIANKSRPLAAPRWLLALDGQRYSSEDLESNV